MTVRNNDGSLDSLWSPRLYRPCRLSNGVIRTTIGRCFVNFRSVVIDIQKQIGLFESVSVHWNGVWSRSVSSRMVLFQEDDESVTFNRTVTCKSVTFKQDNATVFAGRSLFDRPVSLERRCDGHFSIGRFFFRKILSIGRSLDRTVTLARRRDGRFYGPRWAGLFGETVRVYGHFGTKTLRHRWHFGTGAEVSRVFYVSWRRDVFLFLGFYIGFIKCFKVKYSSF